MPEFSLHLPRFLRFHRSHPHSLKPSPPCPHDDTGVPPSRPVLEQAVHVAYGASCPPVSGHPVDPQNSAGHFFVDRAPDDFGGQALWTPRPIIPIDVGSVTQQPTHLASSCNPTGFVEAQIPLEPQPATYTLTTSPQHSLCSEPLSPFPGCYSPQPQDHKQGILNRAHDFTMIRPAFIDGNNVTFTNNNISTTSSQFMKELLEKTIPGAASDSSARYPPPRCHPGTRLAILERCLYFIANCNGEKRMRWVVGAAGVGKSAIMQNVAESPKLPVSSHASVFLSINGRSDGTKTVITLSYQFAAKSEPYRHVIENEIARDPSLLQSSMPVQFNKLIAEPFVHHPQLNSVGRFLIIIDGLDECNDPRIQQELLRLISDFCITYPSSPLVWLIASRPETHITSFFSRRNVLPTYEKEEILVDADEARADVERLLRDKLTEIKEASNSLDPQWPEERDIWKLADAAGGLFAYAHTVIRYIGDSTIGNPVPQLCDVLHVIDEHPMTDVSREEHPLALLDALYDRILSNVPPKVMMNTRKLLLALGSHWDFALDYFDVSGTFIVLCNWLGMTPDEAYAALNLLHSVLYVPRRDKAHEEELESFHKSFIDYISDFSRSQFSRNIRDEARRLKTHCAFRIFKEVPNGIYFDGADFDFCYGTLLLGLDNADKISLAWPFEGTDRWDDRATRLRLYKLAIGEVVAGMERRDPAFRSEFCIRLLTSQLQRYYGGFPLDELRDLVFDPSRRPDLMMHGILKQMPLKAVDISELCQGLEFKLQFRRPATTVTNLSDPWASSCQHEREGEWEEGKVQDWMTTFLGTRCSFCFERLQHQLKSWEAHSPDHTALVLFTSSIQHPVEVRFVDLEDGVSEWTYSFWLILPPGVRQKYGSNL